MSEELDNVLEQVLAAAKGTTYLDRRKQGREPGEFTAPEFMVFLQQQGYDVGIDAARRILGVLFHRGYLRRRHGTENGHTHVFYRFVPPKSD